MKQRIYPIFLPHAGCRQRCVFCCQTITSETAAIPGEEVVAAYLDRVLPPAGEGEIAFYGGSFTWLPSETQSLWLHLAARFVKAGRVSGIRVSTRPDAISEQIAADLHAFGVTTVELGCQSFDDAVLRSSERGHSADAAARAVACLRRSRLSVGLHLMPGLPGADAAEALTSLTAALALCPDFVRIHPTVVLRGARLETLYQQGSYSPLTLNEAVVLCASMVRMCHAAGVTVARLGLQGTEGLDRGEGVVAGPHHPSFGQLVRSRLWLETLLATAESYGGGPWLVHPADYADAVGHRCGNLMELRHRFGDVTIAGTARIDREMVEIAGIQRSIFQVKD